MPRMLNIPEQWVTWLKGLFLLLVVAGFALRTWGCTDVSLEKLKASPAIHETYQVDKPYQRAMEDIHAKMKDCLRTQMPIMAHTDTEAREGEIRIGDIVDVRFLVTVRPMEDGRSLVEVLSGDAASFWPKYVDVVRRGAFGEPDCPKGWGLQ